MTRFERFTKITKHAIQRSAQRAIPALAIETALDWGDTRPVPGRGMSYYLGDRAANRARNHGVQAHDYIGTTVIVSPDGAILTVYRRDRPSNSRAMAEQQRRFHYRQRRLIKQKWLQGAMEH